MDGLAAAHLVVLGLWAGVVAVEVLFELGGFFGRYPAELVADLHRRTDRILEGPLLIAVVTTGLLLWQRSGWSPALWPKVGFGLAAVASNVVCVAFVERRARTGTPTPAQTRLIMATAAPGFPFAAAALWLGGRQAGWW